MLDSRLKMLVTTVKKLYRRGARVNVQRILMKTHTSDVAEVIDNLETGENLDVFRLEESLERRAEILSYLKDETQKELVVMMEDSEAEDIISRMESDDAADLLGGLPEDLSNRILKMMEKEDSEEVTDLMGYPEDSAGGLMSSDFLALQEDISVKDAIAEIQGLEDDSLILFYLYVVDENERLVGVLSLKQLLLAKPDQELKNILTSDVISVTIETDQQEVAKMVERYDFLAIPVVDESQQLMGVITVDDVLDVIREEVEEELMAMGRAGLSVDVSTTEHIKARLPWLLLTFTGGALCFYLVRHLVDPGLFELSGIWGYAVAILPMVLALGATAGNQAVAISLGIIREEGQSDESPIWRRFWASVKVGLPLALFFGFFVFAIGFWTLDDLLQTSFLSSMVGIQVFIAIFFGALMPFWADRLKMDPTIVSIPLYILFADVLGVLMLFGTAHILSGAL